MLRNSSKLVPKHAQQIAVRIRSLQQNPLPQDSSALKDGLENIFARIPESTASFMKSSAIRFTLSGRQTE